MRLIHLGLLHLLIAPNELKQFTVTKGDIEGGLFPFFIKTPGKEWLLLRAESRIDFEYDTASKTVSVLPEAHDKLEQCLQDLANIISVKEGSPCELNTPAVNVALIPESDSDVGILSSAIFITNPVTNSILGVKPEIKMSYPEFINRIKDRPDGLDLLASAQSQKHEAAQFKDYLRFLERAFSAGPHELVSLLQEYFSGSIYGYTKEEIQHWLDTLRHPTIHADRRDEYYLDSDVRPVIWRIRQAAYDILMNKENWRSKATGRKQDWKPEAWSESTDDSQLITQPGNSFRTQMMWVGQYSKLPMNLHAEVKEKLPEEWWIPEYLSTDIS